jgi:hypothetical protein
MLSKMMTEEDVNKLSYELAIARAFVYKNWGFNSEEVATLVDLPESEIKESVFENENGGYL